MPACWTPPAGRWSAGARRPRDGRDADLHRPGQGIRRGGRGGPQPSPEQAKVFAEIVQQQIFTEGSTNAFLVGSILMLAASAVIWIFLDVKHEELATDGPEGVVAPDRLPCTNTPRRSPSRRSSLGRIRHPHSGAAPRSYVTDPHLTTYEPRRRTSMAAAARRQAHHASRSTAERLWRRALWLQRASPHAPMRPGSGCGLCATATGDGRGADPPEDARWALDRLREAHGDLPVVSSATPWAPGWRCTWPTTRRSSASSVLAPWWSADNPVATSRAAPCGRPAGAGTAPRPSARPAATSPCAHGGEQCRAERHGRARPLHGRGLTGGADVALASVLEVVAVQVPAPATRRTHHRLVGQSARGSEVLGDRRGGLTARPADSVDGPRDRRSA